ncbi:hypothetical protein HanRHA438_Chr07g0326831 [Helianthus annuus]|nr:hypothetical protein HanHA89_Chr07g0278081 [Helianthus annuus]KAJ0909930.1 hypothetical protein HanRHA438_Chr07g0326831 [Helianthus annuus]
MEQTSEPSLKFYTLLISINRTMEMNSVCFHGLFRLDYFVVIPISDTCVPHLYLTLKWKMYTSEEENEMSEDGGWVQILERGRDGSNFLRHHGGQFVVR